MTNDSTLAAAPTTVHGPNKYDPNKWLRLGQHRIKERPLGEVYLLESEVREHWDATLDILEQTRRERAALAARVEELERELAKMRATPCTANHFTPPEGFTQIEYPCGCVWTSLSHRPAPKE